MWKLLAEKGRENIRMQVEEAGLWPEFLFLKKQELGAEGTEGQREREKRTPHWVESSMRGSSPRTLRWWQEPKAGT